MLCNSPSRLALATSRNDCRIPSGDRYQSLSRSKLRELKRKVSNTWCQSNARILLIKARIGHWEIRRSHWRSAKRLTGGDGAAGTWGTNVKSLELEKYALSVNVKSLELEDGDDRYNDGRGLKLPVSGNTDENSDDELTTAPSKAFRVSGSGNLNHFGRSLGPNVVRCRDWPPEWITGTWERSKPVYSSWKTDPCLAFLFRSLTSPIRPAPFRSWLSNSIRESGGFGESPPLIH